MACDMCEAHVNHAVLQDIIDDYQAQVNAWLEANGK